MNSQTERRRVFSHLEASRCAFYCLSLACLGTWAGKAGTLTCWDLVSSSWAGRQVVGQLNAGLDLELNIFSVLSRSLELQHGFLLATLCFSRTLPSVFLCDFLIIFSCDVSPHCILYALRPASHHCGGLTL